jgi:protein subunit release factor A
MAGYLKISGMDESDFQIEPKDLRVDTFSPSGPRGART